MTEAPQPVTERRPRLNPFAFPTDTTFRFVLLIVAVIGTTMYVWQWIWFVAIVDKTEYVERNRACLEPQLTANLDAYTGSTRAFSECVQAIQRPMAWWMLGGVALLVGVAAVLTLARPWWIEKRRRLQPLEEADAPAVVAEVRALAGQAGLTEVPRLVWNPLAAAPTGLAYGYAGSYTVALTGGLVVRQATDPEAFRAVVRHELAHVRGRDVDLAYLTISTWQAFLVVAVLPFALTMLDEGMGAITGAAWRLLALAVLVYLTRNAVLRAREVQADVRASVGEDARTGIERVLASLPSKGEPHWRRLLRVHPDPATRLAAVADTRPQFQLELLTVFGAGVAATVAYQTFVDIVSAFVDDGLTMRFVAALAFVPAVIGVVGLGIWRGSFAALAEGRAAPASWPLALALAGGFLVGPELSLQAGLVSNRDQLLTAALEGRGLGWVAALVLILVLLLAWIRAGASAWIRALAGRRSRSAAIAAVLAAAAVMTVVMGVFYLVRDVRPIIGIVGLATRAEHDAIGQVIWALPSWAYELLQNGLVVWTLLRTELIVTLLLVIGFPLAAVLARRRAPATDTSWAFLDPGGVLRTPAFTLRPWRTLVVGLAGGAAFLLAEAVLRFGLHQGVDPDTRAQDAFVLAFLAWQLALAVLVQAGTAAVATAVSAHRARVVDGLAAALVAGSVAAFGILGGPTAGGCVDPLSINPGPCSWSIPAGFFWDVYRLVVLEGALAALAAGLLTVGVLALVRRGAKAETEGLHPAGAAG